MEYIIFWLLFGGCCFAIAKNKNRNEWVALGCGVLFGVFALIYYIVVDKKKEEIVQPNNGSNVVIPTQSPTVKPSQEPIVNPSDEPMPIEPSKAPIDETTQPPIGNPSTIAPDKK